MTHEYLLHNVRMYYRNASTPLLFTLTLRMRCSRNDIINTHRGYTYIINSIPEPIQPFTDLLIALVGFVPVIPVLGIAVSYLHHRVRA